MTKALDLLDKGDIVRIHNDFYRILNRNHNHYLAVNLVTSKINYKLLIKFVKEEGTYVGTNVETLITLYGNPEATTKNQWFDVDALMRRKF